MEPVFFESPGEFRRWLEQHHETAAEVIVGFHKKHSGRPSLTWPESVKEALCFGWIDGICRSIDESSYCIRFTPRRPGSNWSAVNIRHVQALIESGRMQPAGLRAYQQRDRRKDAPYSFEQGKTPELSEKQQATLRANAAAWSFFKAQPPGYQKTATWWVISAKRPETQVRRLETLIEDSAHGRRIALLRRDTKKK